MDGLRSFPSQLITCNRSSIHRPPPCTLQLHKKILQKHHHGRRIRSSAAAAAKNASSKVEFQRRFCDALESLIDRFSGCRSSCCSSPTNDHPLRSGNFLPVAFESPPLPCHLELLAGNLPDFVNGVYLRNGPNQRFPSSAPHDHFFDGDGMLHAVTIKNGQASYCCRFTRTSRFVQEEAAGRALFPKVFATSQNGFAGMARIGSFLLRAALGVTDLSQGAGLANSSIIFHHGKLLALSEDGLPYLIEIQPSGDLLSKGRYTFGVDQPLWAVTSHPKIDPLSDEMFAFGYNPLFPPYLTYFRVSKDGVRSKYVPVSLSEASMIHDFSLTRAHVVFPDIQVVFRPLRILQGKSPIVCDLSKTPRFGVLPRNSQDDSAIQWFDMPGCNCVHFLNSWDEGDEVVLIVPKIAKLDHVLSGDLHNFDVTLSEIRLNLTTGSVKQSQICAGNLEMGNINRNFQGVKNRFVYMGVAGNFPNLRGVVKVDLEERKVIAERSFGENCYASEPFFVPSKRENAAEDEGCVLCFVHDEGACISKLLIMDAQSNSLDIIASVRIPQRVPYGFHGLFVSQEQLDHQS